MGGTFGIHDLAWRIGLGLVAVGLSIACVRADEPARPALGLQWPNYNNRLDGQRFSALKQITADNAAQLGEACRLQVDGATSFTAGLIVADGVIYTGTGHETVALDATDCKLRWRYSYVPEDSEIVPSNRGVAVLDGRVFRGTGDGRLLALDAVTGKLLWKNVIGDSHLGEFVSAAPLAWQGVVYVGVAGGDRAIRGRVMAYDAATGHELWRFDTVPTGHEVGAESWPSAKIAKTGGGGTWGASSLDVTTGELFVPVGNPWPDIATYYRPGANLFTDSIVVLDARSGALKWWYQLTPHDGRDLDIAAPPVLYRDSKIRDIMAFAGKDGYVQAVDRDTHRLLFRVPITTIEHEGAAATADGTHFCPGFAGGTEWNGPALDPVTKLLITGAVDWCFTIKTAPLEYKAPDVSYGGTVKPDPVASGWIVAVDRETGDVRWRFHADKPVIGGITPTAGGVTFAGDMGGSFLVLDSKTGGVLKTIATGGAIAGGIVTYEIAGKQYVALTSGNVSRSTFGVLGMPTVVILALDAAGPDKHAAAEPAPIAAQTASAVSDITHGKAIYDRICTACHGESGNLVEGHPLGNIGARRDFAAIVAFIRAPDAPMPKLFPDSLSAQDVADVATYLQHGIGR